MPYYSFLSYANADLKDPLLQKFIAHLKQDLQLATGLAIDDVLFSDRQSLEHGVEWEPKLRAALGSCNTSIILCSPNYFGSDFCRKELAVLHNRRLRWKAEHQSDSTAVKPIIWIGSPLSQDISCLAYADADYPGAYQEQGLRYLLQLDRNKDDYELFRNILVQKLKAAAENSSLPAMDVPSLLTAGNPVLDPADKADRSGWGPDNVWFAYVTANLVVPPPVVVQGKAYRTGGGPQWRPYSPTLDTMVGAIAAEITGRLGFIYKELGVEDGLTNRLRTAERGNSPVVLITDVWSLDAPNIRKLMADYDDANLLNCVVLVPWNLSDPETSAAKTELAAAVRSAFPKKTRIVPDRHIWWSIQSHETFRSELEKAISAVRMQIIRYGESFHRMDEPGLVSGAEANGIETASVSALPVPTAAFAAT